MMESLFPVTTKGLIYDCDGTLADTMPLHWEAWHGTLAGFGVTCEQSFLDQFSGVPTEVIVERINAAYSCSVNPSDFSAARDKYLEGRFSSVLPIEAVVETVTQNHGRLPMAVVSGGSRKHVTETLEALGLLDRFDVIITADDPVLPKPAPDIFLAAANRLGISPECCHVFEDADAGIQGAVAAGMTFTDVRMLLTAQVA